MSGKAGVTTTATAAVNPVFHQRFFCAKRLFPVSASTITSKIVKVDSDDFNKFYFFRRVSESISRVATSNYTTRRAVI